MSVVPLARPIPIVLLLAASLTCLPLSIASATTGTQERSDLTRQIRQSFLGDGELQGENDTRAYLAELSESLFAYDLDHPIPLRGRGELIEQDVCRAPGCGPTLDNFEVEASLPLVPDIRAPLARPRTFPCTKESIAG